MRIRLATAAAVILWLSTAWTSATGPAVQVAPAWRVPASAATEEPPMAATEAVLAAGRKVFVSKCQRCHGPTAKGNGPDADKKHSHHMDLTRADRVDPVGVVFHKVWNGRQDPKMPAFGDELSKEQAWAVVLYVQSLITRKE
jgi:mono/diheme cytochrome c family protein